MKFAFGRITLIIVHEFFLENTKNQSNFILIFPSINQQIRRPEDSNATEDDEILSMKSDRRMSRASSMDDLNSGLETVRNVYISKNLPQVVSIPTLEDEFGEELFSKQ